MNRLTDAQQVALLVAVARRGDSEERNERDERTP